MDDLNAENKFIQMWNSLLSANPFFAVAGDELEVTFLDLTLVFKGQLTLSELGRPRCDMYIAGKKLPVRIDLPKSNTAVPQGIFVRNTFFFRDIRGKQTFDTAYLKKVHASGRGNMEQAQISPICGCFNCLQLFDGREVTQSFDREKSAWCPRCGIDSVIASASGYEISLELLQALNKLYCGGKTF